MPAGIPVNRQLILLFVVVGISSLMGLVQAALMGRLASGGLTPRWFATALIILFAYLVLVVGQKNQILIPLIRQQAAAAVLIVGWLWTIWECLHRVTHLPLDVRVAGALLFGMMALVVISGRMAHDNEDDADTPPATAKTERTVEATPKSERGLFDFLGTDRQRTIIQHMTDAERAEYAQLGGQQGTWVALSFAAPTALAWAFAQQIGWPTSAAISAVALAVFVWGAIPRRRAADRFIESTQWARPHRD